jgi:hypothetical protein
VIGQFAHCRVMAAPLSAPALAKFGESLAGHFGHGLSVHLSASAGGGKSFAIRRRAVTSGCAYVHIPVNGEATPRALIAAIRDNPDFQGERHVVLGQRGHKR